MTDDNLEEITNKNPAELEEIAQDFVGLVAQRQYSEARVYFKELSKEEQDYIVGHPEYRWSVRALRVSCI